MKALVIAATVFVLVAANASAQQNDATFEQSQGDDGYTHMQISVTYAFPGLPPRTNNSGAGTVRVTLPGFGFKLEAIDPGYSCVFASSDSIVCSSEGQPQDSGTAFPTSMHMRLIATSCWAPDPGQDGAADVWAAPDDPGTGPDVSLPIQPGACAPAPGGQPVLGTRETCKVPNLKKLTLAAATRELKAGDCARGKVGYAYSPAVRKGRVIFQSPRPGKTLKASSKVNLVVSRGKKR